MHQAQWSPERPLPIALSKIPSKDTLLAQLVGSLQGSMQKLAATLQAVADKKSEEAA